jgi:hypothetical protein
MPSNSKHKSKPSSNMVELAARAQAARNDEQKAWAVINGINSKLGSIDGEVKNVKLGMDYMAAHADRQDTRMETIERKVTSLEAGQNDIKDNHLRHQGYATMLQSLLQVLGFGAVLYALFHPIVAR